ncbi:SCAN domain-containing protein 3 [Trichonephila clavipes]|nr:SCAN domain-containing protein 3 [Trichonephila clavipes]
MEFELPSFRLEGVDAVAEWYRYRTVACFVTARCKKPHTIAEELILPTAIEIVETMFGDNFAKDLQSIPLSNDTVSHRIDDIDEDVEQQLLGRLKSIQALVKQKSPLCIWTYCMINREALASKEMSPGLNIELMTVVTVVNYIKMRPPKIKNIFRTLQRHGCSVLSSLLFYCEARWLSRGKFLQRVYE